MYSSNESSLILLFYCYEPCNKVGYLFVDLFINKKLDVFSYLQMVHYVNNERVENRNILLHSAYKLFKHLLFEGISINRLQPI